MSLTPEEKNFYKKTFSTNACSKEHCALNEREPPTDILLFIESFNVRESLLERICVVNL
jgi:hypothetical protein